METLKRVNLGQYFKNKEQNLANEFLMLLYVGLLLLFKTCWSVMYVLWHWVFNWYTLTYAPVIHQIIYILGRLCVSKYTRECLHSAVSANSVHVTFP